MASLGTGVAEKRKRKRRNVGRKEEEEEVKGKMEKVFWKKEARGSVEGEAEESCALSAFDVVVVVAFVDVVVIRLCLVAEVVFGKDVDDGDDVDDANEDVGE